MINPGEPAPGSSPRPPGGRGVSGERRRPPRGRGLLGGRPSAPRRRCLASRRTEKCSNEDIFFLSSFDLYVLSKAESAYGTSIE